ncbi:MAG: hypothetical protein QOI08_2406, partial [Actinomycetota bacterium]|nr:hypothetical protein [Actinomycetota bacterium]
MQSALCSIRRLAVAALVSGIALVGAQVASAATKPFKGKIAVTSNTVLFTHKIGTATETFANAQVTYTGGIKGHASETYVTLTKANGQAIQYGFGEFSGSINGHMGTATYSFSGPSTSGGIGKFLSGTGGLAHVRGGFTYHIIK